MLNRIKFSVVFLLAFPVVAFLMFLPIFAAPIGFLYWLITGKSWIDLSFGWFDSFINKLPSFGAIQ